MERWEKAAAAAVARIAPEIRELSAWIHAHPELSLEETEACRLHTELLRRHGFTVTDRFLGISTAYRAVYDSGKPGPALAFLAEYDALPTLGHACGHNLIGALACAAGIALTGFADQLGGTIYVFGCAGEETNGAKVDMAAQGCFDKMTAAMSAHPCQADGYSSSTMAIDALQFDFYGRASHAASCPEAGINALDACINTFNLVNALRQQTSPTARIHGIITHGGECPNIIPEYAGARFYVRERHRADLQKLAERVVRCAESAAAGCGARVEVSHFEYNNDDLVTNETLSRLFTEKLYDAGFTGELLSGINGGSSDIGNVSYRCPTIQAWFGIGDGSPLPLHTREFAAAAGSSPAIEKALLYAKAFVLTGIHLMEHPETCAEIRDEFQKTTGVL